MCMGGSPSAPPPPPPPQAATPADTVSAMRARRQAGGMATGTLLTGQSGAPVNPMSLSKPSLLGQ